MTESELLQLSVETFAELRIFCRGQMCDRKKIVAGLKTMLDIFEPPEDVRRELGQTAYEKTAKVLPFQSDFSERMCEYCRERIVSQKRWYLGFRLCYVCSPLFSNGAKSNEQQPIQTTDAGTAGAGEHHARHVAGRERHRL